MNDEPFFGFCLPFIPQGGRMQYLYDNFYGKHETGTAGCSPVQGPRLPVTIPTAGTEPNAERRILAKVIAQVTIR